MDSPNGPIGASPEFQLLLALLCLPNSPEVESDVRNLMSRPIDWKGFLDLSMRHKVVPQLYGTLDSTTKDLLPPDARDLLKDLYLRNAKKAMIRSAATVAILRDFEKHSIDALALKGPPLALWAYGDVSHRFAGDLDLFVNPDHADRAIEIIQGRGYTNITSGLRHPDHLKRMTAHAEFRSESLDLTLELHWRLTHHKLMPARFQDLNKRAFHTTITGFPIPVLSPEDRFIYLSVHGSNHGWFRLAWLCDIAMILYSHPELDWASIRARMEEAGLDRVLRQTTNLVDQVLKTPVPEMLTGSTNGNRDGGLVGTALKAMDSDQAFLVNWDKLSWRDIVSGTRYRLRLHRSVRYKAGVLRKMLIRPQDWDDIPLPSALFPLYYILNPVLMIWRLFFSKPSS